jgi:hypothetical protein
MSDILRRDFEASLRAAYTADEIKQQLADAKLDLKVMEDGKLYVVAYGSLKIPEV